MNARLVSSLAIVAVVAAAAIAVRAVPPKTPLAQRLGTTPVIVELFTSQGCSSCPPADALVAQLVRDPALRGRVIPLAFHVDYWDRLGWKDPFSAANWSRRQMIYVRQLRLNSAYTPQAVVNGREQFVGSNSGALDTAIAAASHATTAGTITLDAKRDGDTIIANVHATPPPDTDVVVAVIEYDVTTHVEAGENNGRTIVNEAIVRDLARVNPGRVTIKTQPAWQHLGVVAFLQDRDTLAIRNAALATGL
jgi:hypothetical protein